MIAINSANVGLCWNIAIGSNNEFISIQPAFALADGGLCQGIVELVFNVIVGVISRAVYSLALDKVYLLSDYKTVTVVDCGVSRVGVNYQGIKGLGCEESLPSSALTSVTVNTQLLDLAEPLVPALSSQFIPVVTGVRSSLEPSRFLTTRLTVSVWWISTTSRAKASPTLRCSRKTCRR